MRPERKPLYVNNVINAIYMLEMWELGDILKVADSIPVWGSEIVFLRSELDDSSSVIHLRYLPGPTFPTYISQN